jgi:uncharacterized protein (TIGR03437 family)
MKTILALFVLGWAAYGQNTLNVSRDLVRLGIASTNLVPNQPALDAGPLLFRAVSYARVNPISRVIADPGAYYFLTLQFAAAHVAWDKLSNLTIDLQGSDLYFSNPLAGGISITNGTNIVLQNFTIDYDPLPFTQVRVVSVNAAQQQIQFAVDGNWQNPSVLNAAFVASGGVDVHIFRYGRPIPGVSRLHVSNPIGSTQFTITTDPGLTPSAIAGLIRPGDVAFLCMRARGTSVAVVNCSGCTVRNVDIYAGAAVGFEGAFASSSVFERIYVRPRPGTDRLASTFTGLQMSGLKGNQIRLNRMIRVMDNGMEYGAHVIGNVKTQTDSRTFVLEGPVTSLLASGLSAPNGSAVAFQRPSDGSIVNPAVIASQVAPPYTGQNPYQVAYTFDRDLPASIVGTLMFGTDPDFRAAGSVVERNASEEETGCCNAFFVVGLGDGTFRGNYAQRPSMSGLETDNPLHLGTLVSPPATNFSISNNVIDNANWVRTGYPLIQLGSIEVYAENAPALVTASPHQNISVTGNFVADSGSAAVWLGNTNGGTVSGNYFLGSNENPALESAVSFFGPSTQPLVVQSSQNTVTSNNTVDQTSGRVWVTDGQYRDLAAYAPGSTIRLNAYGLGTFADAPSVILTDADGVAAPAAIQSSTAHALDVQIPSAALGGAYLTVTAGALKYFGTLFVDTQDDVPALNGCTYETSASAASTGASANSLPVLVVTQAGCSYSVAASDAFVSGGASGAGTGVVSVGFAANSGAARNTAIEIAGQPIAITQLAAASARPVIQSVADAWTYSAGLAPGEWVTITGTGLAGGPARVWNLAGAQVLPSILGGVSVTFNGTPSALYYVSPIQINALAPAGIVPGPVQVIVQANGVSSNAFTVTAAATQPAVYALPNTNASTFFVTAALAGTGTLIGNSAVDSRVLRAAQPGDTLDLYMIGLGATADISKFVTDRVFGGAFPVNATVTATIGGKNAPVAFAGLTSPGLYLVRITVPADLAPGPQPIQVSAGTVKTPSTLVLIVTAAN